MRKGEDGERRINRLSSGEEEVRSNILVVGGLASKLTHRAGGENITVTVIQDGNEPIRD